jgi:hypothetical protein
VVTDGGDIHGVMNPGGKPIHISNDAERTKVPGVEEFFVDLGMTAADVKKRVKVGDYVVLNQPFMETPLKIVSKRRDCNPLQARVVGHSVTFRGDALRDIVLGLCDEALLQFNASREREGDTLRAFILERADGVAAIVADVKPRIPALLAAQRERLLARLADAGIAARGFAAHPLARTDERTLQVGWSLIRRAVLEVARASPDDSYDA